MEELNPLVSIAMPVRNCRDTLPLAMRTIQWQTYPHWEFLVFDDGSVDGTNDVARRIAEGDGRIRVLSDVRQLGISYRLNQAIALSRGSLFARMDGDDVSYPERLERQLAYLCSHPDIDLVGAGAVVFNDHGVAIGKRFAPESHDEICASTRGIPDRAPHFHGADRVLPRAWLCDRIPLERGPTHFLHDLHEWNEIGAWRHDVV